MEFKSMENCCLGRAGGIGRAIAVKSNLRTGSDSENKKCPQ